MSAPHVVRRNSKKIQCSSILCYWIFLINFLNHRSKSKNAWWNSLWKRTDAKSTGKYRSQNKSIRTWTWPSRSKQVDTPHFLGMYLHFIYIFFWVILLNAHSMFFLSKRKITNTFYHSLRRFDLISHVIYITLIVCLCL